MPGIEIENLIRRYDDTIRYRQKLFDFNFTEEVNSVLQICVKNREAVEAKLYEKTEECEYLKECLKIAHDKVNNLYTQFENRTNYYQRLLNNNYTKEFLEFAIFLKTRNESGEKINVTLNFSSDDLCEELLKDQFAKDSNNIEQELEALKLRFENKLRECDQLKMSLNEAYKQISTLNSDLKATQESMISEKLQRGRLESERDDLEHLLLKHQKSIRSVDKTRETSSDHSATNEENLIKNNSEIDFDDFLLISPPFDFQDNDISLKNIKPDAFSLKKQEHNLETNVLEGTSNWNEKQERVTMSNSGYFINESTPSLRFAVNELPMQSDISDIEIDRYFCSLQEFHDDDSPVDNSKSTVVKNGSTIDALESSVLGSAIQNLPIPLVANENLVSLKTSNRNIQKLISSPDESSNSTKTSHQSHFECDTCGRNFLEKKRIILHLRKHMKKNNLFHCEKCGESFPKNNNHENIVKCPSCVSQDDDHDNEDKKKLPIISLERERNGKSEKFDGNSNKSQSDISSFYCDICKRQYSTKIYLRAHILHVHLGEKSYECTKCHKQFTTKCNLKRHILVHGSEKPFKCSVCNVGFKDPSDKRKHERNVHRAGGAYLKKAHCDKQLGRKRKLISHIHANRFSALQKQFKCTKCDKSFTTKYTLERHKLAHTSKKSFKCSVCDRYFKHCFDKVRHEKSVHGKGARFRCQHCDRAYKYEAFLNRHLLKDHAE